MESENKVLRQRSLSSTTFKRVQESHDVPVSPRRVPSSPHSQQAVENSHHDGEEARSDMEEAKNQENAKLHSALEEMQQKFKEVKQELAKERENACKVPVEVPVVKEVLVADTALIEKVSAENEKLKDILNSLEKKIEETEKKLEDTTKMSEERHRKAMEAENKLTEMNKAMQSLEEKLSNMESENKVLRQRSLSSTSFKHVQESHDVPVSPRRVPSSPHSQQVVENSHHDGEEARENVDALINCVVQNNGFSQGKPVAAFTTYKCLLHWKSFEAETTSVFDRLIQMIGSAIENNGHLSYWLSNTSSLLFLMQHSPKAGSSGTSTPKTKPSLRTTLFARGFPALLFEQKLTAYVEKIYGIIRDNVKKELTPMLTQCIQAARTTRSSLRRASRRGSSLGAHWQSIIDSLDSLLSVLKENHVPHILVQKMYTQIFSFINVQLFNSFLLRRECCSFTNGEYVKSGLAELEHWCTKATPEYAGNSSDELKHVRQAVGFLVISQKFTISLDEILNDLCPVLSVQQLHRICTLYWDDKFNTLSVSPSVLSSMRALMTENNNDDVRVAVLLDDNSSIPFSVDDIANCIKEKVFAIDSLELLDI